MEQLQQHVCFLIQKISESPDVQRWWASNRKLAQKVFIKARFKYKVEMEAYNKLSFFWRLFYSRPEPPLSLETEVFLHDQLPFLMMRGESCVQAITRQFHN